MKKYTFELIVEEGSDEFWEEITASNKTGCDEVHEAIAIALNESGWEPNYNVKLKLVNFVDK